MDDRSDWKVERIEVAAYRIPTAGPESDGTLEWDATTMVAVHLQAADAKGFGYSYTHEADLTRCLGVSGILEAGALCRARSMPLSGHAAPWLHTHPLCAVQPARHLEFFHDHVRAERYRV